MDISTSIIIVLLAVGSVQGMVYGFILFQSKNGNTRANKVLATLLFLLSYRLIVQIMRLNGVGYYDTWYYLMLDLSWIHGALIYFYTKAQFDGNFKLRKKDWIHFLPLLLQIAFSIFVRLQNLYWDGTRESLSWFGYYGYVVWMNNPTIYIVASTLIILYAYKSLKLINSSVEHFDINQERILWIKRIIKSFFYYFSFVLIILLADLLIFSSLNDSSYFYFTRFYYYPFFIGIAGLTYWIGIAGFGRKNDPPLSRKVPIEPKELQRLNAIADKLKQAMEEDKLYRDQELTLDSLAKSLEIKPYLISKSLSEVFNKRFNDFVNEYRVEEVQLLMQNPKNARYTLLSLAMEAGFNSKSSFNRAVKKHLGISPSELKFGEA